MFSGKTSCGVTINVLQRTPVFTDGTFLIMLIGHPNYQGYPVCKGIGLFMVVGCMCCVVCYCLLCCVLLLFVVVCCYVLSFLCFCRVAQCYCELLLLFVASFIVGFCMLLLLLFLFLFVVIVCCCCLLLCVCLLSVLLYRYTIIDFAIFSTIQPLLFHRGGKVCQRREFD